MCIHKCARIVFAAARWKKPNPVNPSETLMQGELEQFNFRHDRYWVWVAFAIGIGWFFLLNIIVMVALRVLNSELLSLSSAATTSSLVFISLLGLPECIFNGLLQKHASCDLSRVRPSLMAILSASTWSNIHCDLKLTKIHACRYCFSGALRS